MSKNLETKARELLKLADIEIGGNRPWDIQVHNPALFKRILAQGTLGMGESYMDGWWDCDAIDELVKKVIDAKLEDKVKVRHFAGDVLKAKLFNRQSKSRAFEVGEKHYDIGNDLYERMLDSRMTYTCGYWSASPSRDGEEAKNLEEAQEAKLDLVCRKIGLKKGDKVLDIGGGWGSFAKFAAEKYGAEVVAITVSKEQAELGRKRCEGLPVEIRLQDYRDIDPSGLLGAGEKFDHIVSLGMFEHVGRKNYRTYMEVAHKNLKDGGFFLLHTIGGCVSMSANDPWIEKYIFPNSMLPSIAQIGKSIEFLFTMEDWHNFGADYDKTLMAWYDNFNKSWDEIKDGSAHSTGSGQAGSPQVKYNDRFYRMWRFYLLVCAGLFRTRTNNQLWQIVLSKGGVKGGYKTVR